jgi:hypothetical protein
MATHAWDSEDEIYLEPGVYFCGRCRHLCRLFGTDFGWWCEGCNKRFCDQCHEKMDLDEGERYDAFYCEKCLVESK